MYVSVCMISYLYLSASQYTFFVLTNINDSNHCNFDEYYPQISNVSVIYFYRIMDQIDFLLTVYGSMWIVDPKFERDQSTKSNIRWSVPLCTMHNA